MDCLKVQINEGKIGAVLSKYFKKQIRNINLIINNNMREVKNGFFEFSKYYEKFKEKKRKLKKEFKKLYEKNKKY